VHVPGIGQVTVRDEGEKDLHHGDEVFLTPDPSRIYRFDRSGATLR
jgi:multiple sugar transport system ATP-binding protein